MVNRGEEKVRAHMNVVPRSTMNLLALVSLGTSSLVTDISRTAKGKINQDETKRTRLVLLKPR